MAMKILRPLGRYLVCAEKGEFRSLYCYHNRRLCLSSVQQQFLTQRLLHLQQLHLLYHKDHFHKRKYSTEYKAPPRPWIDISFTQLMTWINSKKIKLFDVRTREEVQETGMMPEATNLPLAEVAEALEMSKEDFKSRYGVDMPSRADPTLVFHCLGGIRSGRVVEIAHEAGYFLARHYPGGWEEYEELKNTKNIDSLKPWTDLNYEELMSMIKSKDIQLFDVRKVDEVEETGMMPGATNIPIHEVENAFNLSPEDFKAEYGVDMPSKNDDNVVVHCMLGLRSMAALSVLREVGFDKVRHYPGGWVEYSMLRDH